MTMFRKNNFNPLHPKVKPLGLDTGDGMKTQSDRFLTFICEKHTKFGLKIFEIDFAIKY